MTTGPTDGKVTTPAGGPGGMPLALSLNEGLDLAVCCERSRQPTREEVLDGVIGALLKMGAGPPKSACRSGLQTTASCWGKESWW